MYQDYLAGGQVEYMALVFRSAANSEAEARQLALEFYGPMFSLYSVYDGAADRRAAMQMLKDHVGRFMQNMEKKNERDCLYQQCWKRGTLC